MYELFLRLLLFMDVEIEQKYFCNLLTNYIYTRCAS